MMVATVVELLMVAQLVAQLVVVLKHVKTVNLIGLHMVLSAVIQHGMSTVLTVLL